MQLASYAWSCEIRFSILLQVQLTQCRSPKSWSSQGEQACMAVHTKWVRVNEGVIECSTLMAWSSAAIVRCSPGAAPASSIEVVISGTFALARADGSPLHPTFHPVASICSAISETDTKPGPLPVRSLCPGDARAWSVYLLDTLYAHMCARRSAIRETICNYLRRQRRHQSQPRLPRYTRKPAYAATTTPASMTCFHDAGARASFDARHASTWSSSVISCSLRT